MNRNVLVRTERLPKSRVLTLGSIWRWSGENTLSFTRIGDSSWVRCSRTSVLGPIVITGTTPPSNPPMDTRKAMPMAIPTAVRNRCMAAATSELRIVRAATAEDEQAANRLKLDCEREFPIWRGRIDEWKLSLELIDLEWTLDKSKLILYVLNDRGPECTKLALQAAAAGLGIVEVQPVGPDGPVVQSAASGCGSGHCGSGGDSHGCCG